MRNGFTNQKCPRCGGNIYTDMDYYFDRGFIQWYEQEKCLQCGHVIYDHGVSPKSTEVIPLPVSGPSFSARLTAAG